MAVEHTPPSTYILRELHDVAIPDSVSWAPQTIGWKILGVILLLVAIYLAYRLAQKWWNNRYRKEALQELVLLDARDKNSTERTFKVLKVVLRYLDSSNAKLFGQAYVNRLNAYLPGSANTSENSNAFFADEVSKLWMQSLIDPNVRLSFEQRLEVIQTAMMWLKLHKPNVQVTVEGQDNV
ncbi:DUF4381 domain-containing protein [Vibrio splendidus]|uniref:DUF4381 domain-containing protein n=1 Tax=Vibrio splendidus TaxID=29497 RepID=UPI000D398FF2|nr:DUF4381 domain-containing protein [Vibrio splendidus]MCC4786501.1 DUF4381 domain-containing protein [Vibrio splendidus]MCC4882021.1 DUF4381 domain-containing protein [Vibrio splendidus]PTP26071.1 DUF4381 domain-containing protein [Vibrio splendidus]PTP46086.1 DUF4381 domain-containing protein [Vibrio splendidus]PTP77042.1 DUF4381 domain-containing protein [Vibrio splendidus]